MSSARRSVPTECPRLSCASGVSLRARVRRLVDGEQALGLDAGVALRRRQAGVPEQFLDRPQVAAAAEQVRREAVPQGMRRRSLRQPQEATHAAIWRCTSRRLSGRRARPRIAARHLAAEPDRRRDIPRPPAALPARPGRYGPCGPCRSPRSRSLARRLGAFEAERLGNSQATAIEQRQDRDVAPGLPTRWPSVRRRFRPPLPRRRATAVSARSAAISGRAAPRAPDSWQTAAFQKRMKPRTTDRPRAKEVRSIPSALRRASQPRNPPAPAATARPDRQGRRDARSKIEKRGEIAAIGCQRMRRGAAFAGQPILPQADRAAQLGACRKSRERRRLGQNRKRLCRAGLLRGTRLARHSPARG